MSNENFNISWPGWETVKLIGRGSFGAVYEIERNLEKAGIEEKAALKVISIPQNASDIEEMYNDGYDNDSITETFNGHLKSIVAEYSLMKKMNDCVNIVNCDDIRYIQHDDGIGWDIFIKMELLTPLTKSLPETITDDIVIKLGSDICNALITCKKFDIVHRDIKPQNIFISPNGDYKLGDFGIAKTVEKTMGGTKIGTYKYMAPEVYNNQPYGSAADIYSLGLVLYWLLNERRMPFMPLPPVKLGAGMDEESRHRRLSGEKLPEPAHGSAALKQIVLKACAYDPKDRYASAAAMLEELNRLEGGVAPVVTAVVAGNYTESYEDDKTTGPVFGDTPNTSAAVPADIDETVGPVFAPKTTTRKEPVIEEPRSETSRYAEPAKKPSILKYILIAVAVIAVIILFLLLRSCNGDNEKSGENKPSGSSQTTQSKEWSAWGDELPANISADKYEIEEKTLYSSRELETTSSTEKSTMPGWELYDTVEANGEFGPWSDWSATKAEASATREVDTQTRYRYRDKETTTSSSSTKDGWTKYDTTYSWGNYGSWSGWSTSAVSNSDSRKVETKKQYSYRDISYKTEYTNWSDWSDWQDVEISENEYRQVQTQQVQGSPNYKRYYRYYRFAAINADTGGDSSYTNYNDCIYYRELKLDYELPYGGNLKGNHIYNGWWYWKCDPYIVDEIVSYNTKTQYRYCTRSTQQVPVYSDWSPYSDTVYTKSATREVKERTVYRYCDKSNVTTYHFYRWGDWTSWSTSSASETENRQVQSKTFYRYRDKVSSTTYYFRRWGDWSSWSTTFVSASDEVEVDTKTQYRYKSK